MRFLAFSDIHFHSWTQYASVTKDGINSRLALTAKCVERMFNDAVEAKCEFIAFAGDMFHVRKVDAEVIDVAVRAFRQHGNAHPIPVVGIPGNHDMSAYVSQRHSARALEGEITWLDDYNGPRKTVEGCKVYGVPYMADRQAFEAALEKARSAEPDLLLLHSGFAGATIGSDYVADLAQEPDPMALRGIAPLIISGHYHTPQALIRGVKGIPVGDKAVGEYVPGETILIPGAPEQHTFADVGDLRGWWIVDTDAHTLEFRQSRSPRFIVAETFNRSEWGGNYVHYRARTGTDSCNAMNKDVCAGYTQEVVRATEQAKVRIETKAGDTVNGIIDKYLDAISTPLDKGRLRCEARRIMCA